MRGNHFVVDLGVIFKVVGINVVPRPYFTFTTVMDLQEVVRELIGDINFVWIQKAKMLNQG